MNLFETDSVEIFLSSSIQSDSKLKSRIGLVAEAEVEVIEVVLMEVEVEVGEVVVMEVEVEVGEVVVAEVEDVEVVVVEIVVVEVVVQLYVFMSIYLVYFHFVTI